MSGETTAQRVIRVIARNKKLPADQLSPATKFEDLPMDSLDGLKIVFALEEEFDISISNEDAATMKSVGEAISGVEKLLTGAAADRPLP